MDRLTGMEVFCRVVETGGFSAAARRLGMSTTMASKHVQTLEDRLGIRLLNRTTRKVSLTEIGRLYYERSTQILADLDEAERIAGALQSEPRGTLRLYCGVHIVRFVSPVVAEALQRWPELSVELDMGDRMVDMVEEGYDLMIRAMSPTDSSLVMRRLASWRHILCAAPSWLEKNEPPSHPNDLVGLNCLRYSYYPFADGWHFEGPDGKELAVKVSGNLVTASGDTLRAVCLAGQGVTLGPPFIARGDLEAGRLVPLMPEWRPVEFQINALYPHRHHLSAKVRGFLDLLAERIGPICSWGRGVG